MTKKSSVLSQQERTHRVNQINIQLTDMAENELKALKHREIDLASEITAFEELVVGKFYRH